MLKKGPWLNFNVEHWPEVGFPLKLIAIVQEHVYMSLVTRKPIFVVCDQVRHKPACAAKEARLRLVILDIETRGIILSRQRKTKALISLRG